jgi:GNAT superfamily N-acetyltransferase
MRIDVVALGETVDDAYRIHRAAWQADLPDIPPPSTATFAAGLRHPSPANAWERAIASLDGVPAGYLELSMPLLDNLENASVEVQVDPAYRRRGVGRALLDHAASRVRAAGRKRITSETVRRPSEEVSAGHAFATAMGATAALAETRSRLDVTPDCSARWDAMLAEAWTHADGYRAVTWLGMPPDEFLDDVAYLDGRLFADAPMGELDWEPEKVDAERERQQEQNRLDRGNDRFHAGVVHEASGRLVAWTVLHGAPDIPEHMWQDITLVDPPHRGHRLGMIVKLENLRQARAHRPQLAAIDTFNASSNRHMLSINVAMGFRPVDSWMQWQLTV